MKLTAAYVQEALQSQFEPKLLEELVQNGVYKRLDEGAYLIRSGDCIRSVPILISGSLKIMRPDDEGREALLYYLGGLETCALSLTCSLGNRTSEITAIVEETAELIAIPVQLADEWLCRYATWKQFVFRTYQNRFDGLLRTIDEIFFHKLDERLLRYLKKKTVSCQCDVLTITHEEIAQDLVTSREVISRLLKQLEKSGQIKLMRNKIAIF